MISMRKIDRYCQLRVRGVFFVRLLGSAIFIATFNLQSEPNVVDLPSLFSYIHPFTALKWRFCSLCDGIIIPNSCLEIKFPLRPCFNVALTSGVLAKIMWINIKYWEGNIYDEYDWLVQPFCPLYCSVRAGIPYSLYHWKL